MRNLRYLCLALGIASACAALGATPASAAANGNFFASPTSVTTSSIYTYALTFTNTAGGTGSATDNTRCVKITLNGFSDLNGLNVATTENTNWVVSSSGNVITATAVDATVDQLHKGQTLTVDVLATAP